ncbi:MAG: NAD(P)-dependent oxidoreductase [Bacteroidota bacterium]
MKIGIIREGKVPPDSRVPLTPEQCALVNREYPVEVVIQGSPQRCYADEEYRRAGVSIVDEVADCEVLLGVKEVPIDQLLDNKQYFFFSHTFKKQAYNRGLLQAILARGIHLVDYEALTNERGQRLIAFGHFAGMVGAHNGLLTYGLRSGQYQLPRMKDCRDYAEALQHYAQVQLPALKIVLTGTGRVATGAAQVLRDLGIQAVEPTAFLHQDYDRAVFTQLACEDYAERRDGQPFAREDFYAHPERYQSRFAPYAQTAHIMINGIYWDNRAPAFFSPAEMRQTDFKLEVIADVTCDIAPLSSIPATLRPSTIADPIFGYDPVTEAETAPFQATGIDMMTIDNLPNELPRDASQSFGEQFIASIVQELVQTEASAVIERASVAIDGQLGPHYGYLKDFVAGRE